MHKQLIKDILELEGSTTFLLEFVFGAKLRVDIVSQYEKEMLESLYIERVTRLYFEVPEFPLLYCTSYFDTQKLKNEEQSMLLNSNQPIGKLFLALNPGVYIKKMNRRVEHITGSELLSKLNVQSPNIFKKTYDYWVGERKVGFIEETFSEESFNRVSVSK